ncbi:MAG TPA: hypothetical protein VFU21_05990 [Kofleriaceae bacterium]|nr:hypothetical protein [Kofleriaceae bacterium]
MRPALVTVLSLAACSSSSSTPSPPPPAAAEKTEAPRFRWPVPDGWRAETIPFPLEFAPDIERRGVEELRFAPGFFQPEAAGYWTYAFAWVVTDQRPADPATLAPELTAYFRGLTRAVAAEKKDLPALDLARIDARLAADGRGTVHTFDAFGDGRAVELDVTVTVQPCGSGRAILVAAAPRGKAPLEPGPAEVVGTFRCDAPLLK